MEMKGQEKKIKMRLIKKRENGGEENEVWKQ